MATNIPATILLVHQRVLPTVAVSLLSTMKATGTATSRILSTLLSIPTTLILLSALEQSAQPLHQPLHLPPHLPLHLPLRLPLLPPQPHQLRHLSNPPVQHVSTITNVLPVTAQPQTTADPSPTTTLAATTETAAQPTATNNREAQIMDLAKLAQSSELKVLHVLEMINVNPINVHRRTTADL